MNVCIEIKGLSKRYGSTIAITDLNLAVERGEVFGFLGPNGAGKTTTIRIALALQRQDAGAATVFGLDTQHDSTSIHRRVGYVPGDLALYPRMTGAQHVEWFARARSISDRRATDDLIARFKVVVDRPVRELSKGNRQKIGLVLAFMHAPELLILDEPTSGLDPLMQKEFELLVRETVAAGRTVFLSSHELDEVQRLADRVGIIREGRLVAVDTVEGLRRNAPLRIEATFPTSLDRTEWVNLAGVDIVRCEGTRLELEVTGPLGPVLKQISEHNPVDLISRRADLDELFMKFYDKPAGETKNAL